MKRSWLLLLALLVTPLWAADEFKPNVDYQVIEGTKAPIKAGSVVVEEFFSYGCPWCFKIEGTLETWRKSLPKSVTFKRVPVVFESGWEWYAKAYYIALQTNQESAITPKIFNAIHEKKEKLNSSDSMEKFLVANGVSADVAKSGLNQSALIDSNLVKDMNTMREYRVMAVPCLIVNGRYRTDLQLAKGDIKRLIKITDYLIEKSKKG